MSVYRVDITIPPNTDKDSALEVRVKMRRGLLNRVRVEFPPGCCNLAHFVICHKERQLFPDLPETAFSGDTFPIEFISEFELVESPYELIVRAWNIDNLYPHIVTAYFVVVDQRSNLVTYLSRLLGV